MEGLEVVSAKSFLLVEEIISVFTWVSSLISIFVDKLSNFSVLEVPSVLVEESVSVLACASSLVSILVDKFFNFLILLYLKFLPH